MALEGCLNWPKFLVSLNAFITRVSPKPICAGSIRRYVDMCQRA